MKIILYPLIRVKDKIHFMFWPPYWNNWRMARLSRLMAKIVNIAGSSVVAPVSLRIKISFMKLSWIFDWILTRENTLAQGWSVCWEKYHCKLRLKLWTTKESFWLVNMIYESLTSENLVSRFLFAPKFWSEWQSSFSGEIILVLDCDF